MIDIFNSLILHGHMMLSASSVNLGKAQVVQTSNASMTSIGGELNTVTGYADDIIGPTSLLGMTAGALGHANVFHSPQLKEHSKEIMKYSAYGIAFAIAAPLAVSALSAI